MAAGTDAEYILPLRWTSDDNLDELTTYLEHLRRSVDITIVDGSDDHIFAAHAERWRDLVRHVPVSPTVVGLNGKVRGVLTGLAIARHDAIILADDDVRYEAEQIEAVIEALATADLVRPQNYFHPLPWHARWDSGRMLINRSLATDFPGTYGLRRSALGPERHYDPDVLFENLEMERAIIARGGIVSDRPDILVLRRPPTAAHFLSQRVRQAYDSQAQPARLALELSIAPVVLWSVRKPRVIIALALAVVGLAEFGRRSHGGRRVFPATSALWTPVWVAERGVTSWWALGLRMRGGVVYGSRRIRIAAHSVHRLSARINRR